MNYSCPSCRTDLGSRKLIGAIVARMEIDCTFCYKRMRLNVHPLESAIVYGSFGVFIVLAAMAYFLNNQTLVLFALAAGMVGPTVLPVIERTWLKEWPRYVRAGDEVSK